MSTILLLILYLFIVAVIATIKRYKIDIKNRPFVLFYFWFTACKELFAYWYGHYMNLSNLFLFNLYQIIEMTVLFLAFRTIQNKSEYKKISLFIYTIYVVYYFYSIITQDIKVFFDYSYSVGSVSIVLIILLYFYEILNTNQVMALNKNFMFWFGAGLLIYHLPSIPFTLLLKYYLGEKFKPSFFIANYVLIFLSNSTFIYGLLCAKPSQT